jgi:hypothetical protein
VLRKTVLGKIALGLALACIVPACAQTSKPVLIPTSLSASPPQKPHTSVMPTMLPNPEQEITKEIIPTPSGLEDTLQSQLVKHAKEDLASRLSLDLDQISLVEAKSVFWRDASLGCPQPGMVYAQVITPGFRITLEAKGQIYDYHADKSRYVFLCETKETPIEPVPLMPVAPHGKPPKCKQTPCP